MSRFVDLTGKRFGKLIVIKKVENNKYNKIQWLCRCDCGNVTCLSSNALTTNNTKSCGCLKRERKFNLKHGKTHTRLYNTYNNMKSRCYNKNNKRYKNYGGRGIIICDEWLNKESGFINFYNWAMQNGYKDDLKLNMIYLKR